MSSKVGSVTVEIVTYDVNGQVLNKHGIRIPDIQELDNGFVISEIGRTAMDTLSLALGLGLEVEV